MAYKAKVTSKMHLIQDAYQLARDAGSFLTFYQHSDNDYLNILQLSSAYENLIIKKKLVPPFGTVQQLLFNKFRCLTDLKEIFGIQRRKSLLTAINTTLTDDIVQVVQELDQKMEAVEIGEVMDFAQYVREAYQNTTCSNESREICSLATLYDMLELRDRIKQKRNEIEILQHGLVKNFFDLLSEFVRLNDTSLLTPSKNREEESRKLKRLLEHYLNHINFCLTKTNEIYKKILSRGQPSLKSLETFEIFTNNLNEANFTLFHICKYSGYAQLLFNVKDRTEIAWKIVDLLSKSETAKVKSIGFNKVLIDFVENSEKKFKMSDQDNRLLNQSLKDIESMNVLLNQYLNQTTQNIFKKSVLFNLMYVSNQPFQRGINVSALFNCMRLCSICEIKHCNNR